LGDEENQPQKALALLEDISPSGACVQLENAIPLGTEVHWIAPNRASPAMCATAITGRSASSWESNSRTPAGGRRRPLSHCICWIWKGWWQRRKNRREENAFAGFFAASRPVRLVASKGELRDPFLRGLVCRPRSVRRFRQSAAGPAQRRGGCKCRLPRFHKHLLPGRPSRRIRPSDRRRLPHLEPQPALPRIAFNNMEPVLQPFEGLTFPGREYAVNPSLPFSIQFVSPRTVRIRIKTGVVAGPEAPSPMLVGEPPHDNSWKMEKVAGATATRASPARSPFSRTLGTSSFATPRAACSPRPSTLPTSPLRSIPRCHSPSSAAPPITRAAWPPSFRCRPMRNCSAAAILHAAG